MLGNPFSQLCIVGVAAFCATATPGSAAYRLLLGVGLLAVIGLLAAGAKLLRRGYADVEGDE